MAVVDVQHTWTIENGYVTDQPLFGNGLPGTVVGGEQVLIQGGRGRIAAPPADMSETAPTSTYGFTINLVAGNTTATFNAGATAKADFRAGQHILAGNILYLIKEVIDDLHLRLGPKPTQTLNNQTVKSVPVIHALDEDRATLLAGNVVKFRGEAIVGVGRGGLKVNGTALNAALTASDKLRVAYPD